MLKLISFITGRRLVWLLHWDSKVTMSIEIKKNNPFTNGKYCYVYWGTKTGLVNLHENGETSGRPYISKWMYC
jgi:hypothetical protein